MVKLREIDGVAFALIAGLGLAACSDDDRPPALTGGITGLPDADGGTDLDGGPDPDGGTSYTGPRGDVSGDLFAMEPSGFSPFWTDEPLLAKPARVFYMNYGETHESQYEPGVGFDITGIPVGEWLYIMVEDIDDGNGIMPTAMAAAVGEGSADFKVPALLRSQLETIYGSTTPPISLDTSKSHVLVTLLTCALQGNMPMSGATFAPVGEGEVIYKNATGWAAGGPTDSSGMLVMVNAEAEPAPGQTMAITYEFGGKMFQEAFQMIGGFVTRVMLAHPC